MCRAISKLADKFFDRKAGMTDQGPEQAAVKGTVIGDRKVDAGAFLGHDDVGPEPAQNPAVPLKDTDSIHAGDAAGEFGHGSNGDLENPGRTSPALPAGVLIHHGEAGLNGGPNIPADLDESFSLTDTARNGGALSPKTGIFSRMNQYDIAHLLAPFIQEGKFSSVSLGVQPTLASSAERRTLTAGKPTRIPSSTLVNLSSTAESLFSTASNLSGRGATTSVTYLNSDLSSSNKAMTSPGVKLPFGATKKSSFSRLSQAAGTLPKKATPVNINYSQSKYPKSAFINPNWVLRSEGQAISKLPDKFAEFPGRSTAPRLENSAASADLFSRSLQSAIIRRVHSTC